MTLKEKATEITEFQTHLLQGFLSLSFENHRYFEKNDWRDAFKNCVNSAKTHKANYAKGMQLLANKQLSEIEVSDLDITLIVTLLLYTNEFKKIIEDKDEIIACLYSFRMTRNENSHRDGHESELDYYRWFSGMLFYAGKFIDLTQSKLNWVKNSQSADSYFNEYRKKIETLIESVDKELITYAIGDRTQYAIEFDVNYLDSIKGDDIAEAYHQISNKYLHIFKLHQNNDSYDTYMRFLHACAEKKIDYAFYDLYREYYLGGGKQDGTTVYPPNYGLSAKYFKKYYLNSKSPTASMYCKVLEFVNYGDISDPNGTWKSRAEKALEESGYMCVKIKSPNSNRLFYMAQRKTK